MLALLSIFFVFVVVCLLNNHFFKKKTFKEIILKTLAECQNSLDPDQGRHSVGPYLGPNCLQRLSADGKSHC